jgi:hypothetical protein
MMPARRASDAEASGFPNYNISATIANCTYRRLPAANDGARELGPGIDQHHGKEEAAAMDSPQDLKIPFWNNASVDLG